MNYSMQYIIDYYGVPAKIGKHVEYNGKRGVIKGARNAYLLIQLEGEKKIGCYHPTEGINYLENKEIKP